MTDDRERIAARARASSPAPSRSWRDAYFGARGLISAALLAALLGLRLVGEEPVRWTVLPVIAAAMLLRAWAGNHLGPHGNGARLGAPALARTGPYAYSRHPLYLANIVTGVGLVLFANLDARRALPLILAVVAHHVLLARLEERALREEWPEAYDAYANEVPRWFGVKPPQEAGDRTTHRAPEASRTPQARNLVYTASTVLLIWGAERLSRLG